jgi:hypothetical protein
VVIVTMARIQGRDAGLRLLAMLRTQFSTISWRGPTLATPTASQLGRHGHVADQCISSSTGTVHTMRRSAGVPPTTAPQVLGEHRRLLAEFWPCPAVTLVHRHPRRRRSPSSGLFTAPGRGLPGRVHNVTTSQHQMWSAACRRAIMSGVDVNEVLLPGIGLRYEFTSAEGRRIGIVARREKLRGGHLRPP